MPKVTLSSLRRDVVDAAKAVARETVDEMGDTPSEDSSVIVTECDLRLWKATFRLLKWEQRKKRSK